MHILITGGAGFIGSYIARYYLSVDCKVTVIDNLSTGTSENIPLEANFINKDITEHGWTQCLPDDITHVIHLAAQSSGEISFENPLYDVRTNTVATLELLNWSLKNQIKKFIFSSSMNVYGNVKDEPISEDYENNPASFYAVGKVASENYIKIFSELGLDSVILRLFNVYGPGQNMNNMKQGMVSIYSAYIINNETIIVKGSTDRFRDFVYIDDVVKAVDLALKSKTEFDIFNVCTGVRTTVKEVIYKISKSFNYDNYPFELQNGTPRDQFGIYGSYGKINKLLGWSPNYDLKNGLSKMVDFLLKK
jgi:UDP-glucose 4-epimerase